MAERYVMVTWPEVEEFMREDRWSECKFCSSTPNHPCPDCTYMIPEDLYNKVKNK